MSENRENEGRQVDNILPKGVVDAEKAIFDDIVGNTPDGISHEYIDILDQPQTTREKPVANKALARIRNTGGAIVRFFSELPASGGAALWEGEVRKKTHHED